MFPPGYTGWLMQACDALMRTLLVLFLFGLALSLWRTASAARHAKAARQVSPPGGFVILHGHPRATMRLRGHSPMDNIFRDLSPKSELDA
jgi:hypothetical protein